jgi:hypothetical protein
VSEAVDGFGRSGKREKGRLGERLSSRLFLRRFDERRERREAFGRLETSESDVAGPDPAENVEVGSESRLRDVDLLEVCELRTFVRILVLAIIPYLFYIRIVVFVTFESERFVPPCANLVASARLRETAFEGG